MKIFISSTFRDLKAERWELLNGFKKAGLDSWGMEFFAAQADTAKDVCLAEVVASDLLILVIGDRYGSIDPQTGKSFTQLEYEKAKEEKRDILAFLSHDISPYAEHKELLGSFREMVKGDVTPAYFTNPAELYNEVWASLFKTLKRRGMISRTSNTFEYFCDFFADTLNEARLFSHKHKLVGRSDELAAINTFVQDDDKRMLIVNAAGGVGKTKLLYEYSKRHIEGQGEYSVRYVSGYGDVRDGALDELPSSRLLIVIDDAHLNNDIEKLLKMLLEYKYRDTTKLVISTRPSGIGRIKRSLCRISAEDDVLDELHLETLDAATFAKELAKDVLGVEMQRHVDQLVRASGGNALIITIAGQLLRLGKVDAGLLGNADFQNMVMEKMLEDVIHLHSDITPDGMTRRMAFLDCISPFERESADFRKAFADYFEMRESEVSGFCDSLEEHGLLLRRGRKYRIWPDLLGDYILRKASLNSDFSTKGFIEEVIEKCQSFALTNIVSNVAALEFEIFEPNQGVLLERFWAETAKSIRDDAVHSTSSVLAILSKIAVYTPKKSLECIKQVISCVDTSSYVMGAYAIENLASSLKRIALHHDYTQECCGLLSDIAQSSKVAMNALIDLATINIHKGSQVNLAVIKYIHTQLGNDLGSSTKMRLLKIITTSLARDFDENTSDGKTFSMRSHRVFSYRSNVNIMESRKLAIECLDTLTGDVHLEVVLATVRGLVDLTMRSYAKFSSGIEPAETHFWAANEGLTALDILSRVLGRDNITDIRIEILNILRKSRRGVITQLAEGLDDIIKTCDVTDLRSKVMDCLTHGFRGNFEKDWKAADREFEEYQGQTAVELWKDCGEQPQLVFDFIESCVLAAQAVGIKIDWALFLSKCAGAKQDCVLDMIAILLKHEDQLYSLSVSSWIFGAKDESKYVIACRILEKGNKWHLVGLANAKRHLKNVGNEQLIPVLSQLLENEEPMVRDAALTGIGYLYNEAECPAELIQMLVNCDVGDDATMLDHLLENIDRHYGIPFEALNATQIDTLLSKFEHVNQLESNDYSTMRFLTRIIAAKPKQMISLFIRRTESATKYHSNDFRPMPFTWEDKEWPDMSNHSDFHTCIDMIFEAIKRDDSLYRFWCPKLFKVINSTFTEAIKQILLSKIASPDQVDVVAVSRLLEEYESDFLFSQYDFISKLLIRANEISTDCHKQVQSCLFSLLFGKAFSWAAGSPPPHFVRIVDGASEILKSEPEESVKSFYNSLREYANSEIARNRLEDEEDEL